jgi:predicted nucleic acid-binding protein
MAVLLDTDVLIHLRDGDREIADQVAALNDSVLMSLVSRVELEGGVWRDPGSARVRRARLDVILAAIPALAFDAEAADAYGAIVASAGYSRCKLLDRMIAAQALVHRATLATRNASDYADIPSLNLLRW